MFMKVVLCTLVLCPNLYAATQVSMNVSDLKSGVTKTKISFPLWVVKLGSSMANIVEVKEEKVDLPRLISVLEKQEKTGEFLVIEDHQSKERVSFSLN